MVGKNFWLKNLPRDPTILCPNYALEVAGGSATAFCQRWFMFLQRSSRAVLVGTERAGAILSAPNQVSSELRAHEMHCNRWNRQVVQRSSDQRAEYTVQLIEPASEGPPSTAEQAALIERDGHPLKKQIGAPLLMRVEKSFVLVVPSDPSLIRVGKGAFMRGPGIDQYTKELEKLYANANILSKDHDSSMPGDVAVDAAGLDGATRLVLQHVQTTTGRLHFPLSTGTRQCDMEPQRFSCK